MSTYARLRKLVASNDFEGHSTSESLAYRGLGAVKLQGFMTNSTQVGHFGYVSPNQSCCLLLKKPNLIQTKANITGTKCEKIHKICKLKS